MKPEYFECQCSSPEHLWRVWFDDDPSDPCIFMSVFLSNAPWYSRIVSGLKYIFGHKSRYGHFDEFILKAEDCDRLIEVLERLKAAGGK